MAEHMVVELFGRGRLREAWNIFRRLASPSLHIQVLAAYIESEVGSPADVETRVASMLARKLEPADRALCHGLIARVAFKYGRHSDGVRHYHSALEWAERACDRALVAQLLAFLVPAVTHAFGYGHAFSEVQRLRQAAFAAADIGALTVLHLLTAELEAKRGWMERASYHLRMARQYLELRENQLYDAQYHLVVSALFERRSDFRRALTEALRALDIARQAGATSVVIPAMANVAYLQLTLGFIVESEATLRLVQQSLRYGSAVEIGVRDTALQLELARGQLGRASEMDRELVPLMARLDDPYYALWSAPARVRLLLRTNREQEAVQVARDAIPRIERMGDRNLLARMRLLAAESLAIAGRTTEAGATYAQAVVAGDELPLEILAEASRVAGRLAGSHLPAAIAHFERAGRILAKIGHVTARGEVVLNAGQAFLEARAATNAPLSVPWDELPTLYTAPNLVQRRLDTSRPIVADPRPAAAPTLEAAAALFDLASHASLAGHEIVALVHAAGAADAAALVEHPFDAPARPLVWIGCDADAAVTLAARSGSVVLPLGTEHGARYEVAMLPAADPAARPTLAAIQRLAAAAQALEEAHRRERERAALWPDDTPEQQLGFIVASEPMTTLVQTMRRLAASPVPVLIIGETGTGKELLARALHDNSPRREGPFVPFNCTAVPKELADSQLFGHRRGAFTGAHESFPGVIRAAAGGTLLLDEIGDLGFDVQPKLLRFLESGEVQPLGESRPTQVDVRVLAATNRPLEQLVAEGRFREDLYYRLNVVRLEIPPLRERREEIPVLVNHFLEKWSREAQKADLRLAEETMEYLVLYRWPGNVRELANEVRRLVTLAENGAVLMPEHLSAAIAASRRTLPPSERVLEPTEMVVRVDQPLAAALEHVERALVQRALRLHPDRVEDAARALGLSRKGLYLKRQRLGLD